VFVAMTTGKHLKLYSQKIAIQAGLGIMPLNFEPNRSKIHNNKAKNATKYH